MSDAKQQEQSQNIFFFAWKNIIRTLDGKQKRKAIGILFFGFINSLAEVLGLAFILPVIYLLNDPTPIQTNKYLNFVYELFNFETVNGFLTFLMLLLLFVFFVKNLVNIAYVYAQNNFGFTTSKELTNRQFAHFFSKDYQFFKNHNSNFLIRNIIRIPSDFNTSVLQPFLLIISELIVITIIVVGLFAIDYRVFLLIAVTLVPFVALLTSVTKKRIKEIGNEKNELQPITYKKIFESIYGYIDLKLFRKEHFFADRANTLLGELYSKVVQLKIYQVIPHKVVETSAVLGVVVIFLFLIYTDSGREEVISLLVLFAVAAYRLMPSLNKILGGLVQIRGASFVFDTLVPFEETVVLDANKENTIDFNAAMELKNIGFSYEGKETPAVDNLSLSINKGDVVGFVGESGSGKSTLTKIILGLLIEDQGALEIDGTAITHENAREYFDLFGYVQQDFYLMDASLAENVAFGEDIDHIDASKVEAIVDKIQLREVIDKLEEGIYANIGEFGGNLSGGQRQRIAIARALYKDAQILVFDEATSALDNNTEQEIMKTIYELNKKQNLTLIIVAHRITTLSECNKIFNMEEGKLEGIYSYPELLKKEMKKQNVALD